MAGAATTVLTQPEVRAMMEVDIAGVSDIMGQWPVETLRVLMDRFRWDSQSLLDSFFSDDQQTLRKAGCVDPDCVVPTTSPSTLCGICFDSLGGAEQSSHALASCGHTFCHACWADYLRQAVVEEGRALGIQCPMLDCPAFLTDSLVLEVCQGEHASIADAFWRNLTKCYVDKKPTLCPCPTGSCKLVVSIPEDRPSRVQCDCGQAFCPECSRPNHYTVPCVLIEEWQAQSFQDEVKINFVIIMTKKCPNCKTDIEKNGGCPNMKCSRCKESFCWTCLQPSRVHEYGKCNSSTATEGDQREVEAEEKSGEERRFRLFQMKFQKIEKNLGNLILPAAVQRSLWSLLKDGLDSRQFHQLMISTNFPVKLLPKDYSRKRSIREDMKALNAKEKVKVPKLEGGMGTFPVAPSSSGAANGNPSTSRESEDDSDEDSNIDFIGNESAFTAEQGGRRRLTMDMMELRAIRRGRGTQHLQISVNMLDVVEALKEEMVKKTDFWFPTDHLQKGANAIAETQRVLMFSQVFAFYLGCKPPYNMYGNIRREIFEQDFVFEMEDQAVGAVAVENQDVAVDVDLPAGPAAGAANEGGQNVVGVLRQQELLLERMRRRREIMMFGMMHPGMLPPDVAGMEMTPRVRAAIERRARLASLFQDMDKPIPSPHSSNDPKTMDADMFGTNLENLEKVCRNLSDSLFKVTQAYLRLKVKIASKEYGEWKRKKEDLQNDFYQFCQAVEETKTEIITNTSICVRRKDAVVSLMEDGFGDRSWSFRTVSQK